MRHYLDGTTSSSPFEARLGREEFGGEVHAYGVAFTPTEVAAVGAIADKVIFNSRVAAAALRRRSPTERRSGCGSTRGSATRRSTSPTRRAATPASASWTSTAMRALAPDRSSGVMFHFNCENDDVDDLLAPSTTSPTATATCSTPCPGSAWAAASRSRRPAIRLDRFVALLRGLAERFGVQVYLEPGEACITSSAELVTTVLDVVHNEVDVAIVDSSVEAHMLDHLIYGTSPRLVAAGGRGTAARSSPGAPASPATCSASTTWPPAGDRRRGAVRRCRRLHHGQDHVVQRHHDAVDRGAPTGRLRRRRPRVRLRGLPIERRVSPRRHSPQGAA